jgi:hypothetical protein
LSNLVPAQLRLVDAHGRSTSASISRIPYFQLGGSGGPDDGPTVGRGGTGWSLNVG